MAAVLWNGACPGVAAQPLERGIASGDGRRVLLDDGAIGIFSSDFKSRTELPMKGVQALYQGTDWQTSFLALLEKGLVRVDTASASLPGKEVVSGQGVRVAPWGQSFLAYQEKGNDLVFLSSQAEQRLALGSALVWLEVAGPGFALARTEQALLVLQMTPQLSLTELELPFPLAETKLARGGDQAVVWSPQSQRLIRLDKDGKTVSLTPPLPEPPTHGARVLEDGTLLGAGKSQLMLVSPAGEVQAYPAPEKTSETSFAAWQAAASQEGTWLLLESEQGPRLTYYPRGDRPAAGPQTLPAGSFHSFVFPAAGKSGRPLLFWETSLEEPRIDADGRKVLDLRTGEPAQVNVTGHQLYALEPDGRLTPIVDEPRGRLVGPVQRIGERAVYATQTEPEHREGQALEVNPRYPYPPVRLQGRSLAQPSDLWAFARPRGESPSKDRIPEDAWPVLDTGALLATSEDNRLLAIDPESGALSWSSPQLPLDESAPPMLSWSDGFALVATKGTTRSLLVLDPSSGKLLDTVSLTETFFWERWRHLIGVMVLCFSLAYYIYAAGRRQLYIRKIAGLQALDEAVGRATEMGKPVLYVVGLADVDDIQTMASLSILSHVARKTAEYDTPIVTTTARAVAFSAAQEIVRDAFSVAGRPDAFSVESVRYISDDQFGYTAGVDGIMVREKPAANFYIGNFYAESLILAETGHATGSIQMAGTSQVSQIPFFVAACDYTLIGEELFAASAYLSRDPLQVGSLRGQDVGKALVMILLVVCSLLVSVGADWAWLGEKTGWTLP